MKTFAEMMLDALAEAIDADDGTCDRDFEEKEKIEPMATKHERFARELRELVDALQAEGFSRSEALMLAKAAIAASGKS